MLSQGPIVPNKVTSPMSLRFGIRYYFTQAKYPISPSWARWQVPVWCKPCFRGFYHAFRLRESQNPLVRLRKPKIYLHIFLGHAYE